MQIHAQHRQRKKAIKMDMAGKTMTKEARNTTEYLTIPVRVSKRGVVNEGAPTKYREEYCEMIIDFFDIENPWEEVEEEHTNTTGEKWTRKVRRAKKLPTLRDFGRSVGVDYKTVWEWKKVYEEFRNAVHRAEELRKDFLIQNGLLGLYPPQAYKFTAINLTDMRDSKDITSGGQPILPQVVEFGRQLPPQEPAPALPEKFPKPLLEAKNDDIDPI